MAEDHRLLAQGRDCDILDLGAGRVLRRQREGRSLAAEADVMEHVRAAGYPVPRVHEVRGDGSELVLDRVEGRTMLDHLVRPPWHLRRHARTLAGLHDRLHRIPAAPGLAAMPDGGTSQLHLDLHPLNVMLSPDGPVVIDWTNAAAGDGATDVALTWVVLATSIVDGPAPVRAAVRSFQRVFTKLFVGASVEGDGARLRLRFAGELRLLDPNVSTAERDAVRRLVARSI